MNEYDVKLVRWVEQSMTIRVSAQSEKDAEGIALLLAKLGPDECAPPITPGNFRRLLAASPANTATRDRQRFKSAIKFLGKRGNMKDSDRLIPMGTGPIGVWFFELQTGIFHREDWKSNFYHYRLRNSHGHEMTSDWLEKAVWNATDGPNGLVYPPEFCAELERAEKELDNILLRHPDIAIRVPRKEGT